MRHDAIGATEAIMRAQDPRSPLAQLGERDVQRWLGPLGDFACWIWAFEMSEPERELFRLMAPAARMDFLARASLWAATSGPHIFGSAAARLRKIARAKALAFHAARGYPGSPPEFPLVQQRPGAKPPPFSPVAWGAMAHWRATGGLIQAWRRRKPALALFSGALFVFSAAAGAWPAPLLGCALAAGLALWGASDRSPWRQLLIRRARQAYPDLSADLPEFASARQTLDAFDLLWQQEIAQAPASDEGVVLWRLSYGHCIDETPWPAQAWSAHRQRRELSDGVDSGKRSAPCRL